MAHSRQTQADTYGWRGSGRRLHVLVERTPGPSLASIISSVAFRLPALQRGVRRACGSAVWRHWAPPRWPSGP